MAKTNTKPEEPESPEKVSDFSSLLTILENLDKTEQTALQGVLQLYLDPSSSKKTENEKRKELEEVLLKKR